VLLEQPESTFCESSRCTLADFQKLRRPAGRHLLRHLWAQLSTFLPEPQPIGRARTTDLREAVNAILYIASSGCAWSLLPREIPPFTTVQRDSKAKPGGSQP
jgi:transposase